MIHFIAGVVFGALACAVAGVVGGCIYIENNYPKTLAQFRAEQYEAEGDDIW